MTNQNHNIWEGVYENWDLAPGDDDAFKNDFWIEKISQQALKTLESYHSQDDKPLATSVRENVLPLTSAMISLNKLEPLRILDFGGGMGAGYLLLKKFLCAQKLIEYHIVEGEDICQRGKKIFSSHPNLHFHLTTPRLTHPVHIIHLGSSLQYIENWCKLIASFISLKPRYLILTDVLAGDIKSFVTIQNFYGKKIRVNFKNLPDFLSSVEELGFRLIFKSNYYTTICGRIGPLPMQNFDKKYQLEHTCQLIFKWID
ncbi:MAG: methyltransferase, TIGR04325 family [Nitrospina sp.]|nr:methyltransferase, TIGR04325 family [Nitrospina sp.]MBT6601992.1 methyltransferase, TIGR04325 family [Nitrospina sp.]